MALVSTQHRVSPFLSLKPPGYYLGLARVLSPPPYTMGPSVA